MTRPAKVFIVDDSHVIQTVLQEMLGELPNVTIVGMAESANQAITEILRVRPDCVFLDLNLLEGNGLQVLQAVHPLHPDIVFIVMTNNEGEKYRNACMAAGASHFLDKTNELGKIKYAIAALEIK